MKRILQKSLIIFTALLAGAGTVSYFSNSHNNEGQLYNSDDKVPGGSAPGGLPTGRMKPHNETQGVLGEWFEYETSSNPVNSKGKPFHAAVNYALNDNANGSQDYVVGMVIDKENKDAFDYIQSSGRGFYTGFPIITFHSKYWASLPVNGINRSDPTTLQLRDDLKYHALTVDEAKLYNETYGYTEKDPNYVKEGGIALKDPTDPTKKGIFYLDGDDLGSGKKNTEIQYGGFSPENDSYGLNPFAVNTATAGEKNKEIGNLAPVYKDGDSSGLDVETLNNNLYNNPLSPGVSLEPSPKDEYQLKLKNVKSRYTYDDWHALFSEDAESLYGNQYDEIDTPDTDPTAHPEWDQSQYITFTLPLQYWENDPNPNDHFGFTPSNNNGSVDIITYGDGTVDQTRPRRVISEAFSPNDALSLSILLFKTKGNSYTVSFTSAVDRYSSSPDENGHSEMLLSYPNPKFNVDIKGYDENNDFLVDVTYDHTPTPVSYSNVNYIEYIMRGPKDTTPEGKKEQSVWDHIIIGDNWAYREYRPYIGDHSQSIEDSNIVVDTDFYDNLKTKTPEWFDNNGNPDLEGDFTEDSEGNEVHVGGYPSGMNKPVPPTAEAGPTGAPADLGDMNISIENPINETLNYGGLYYGTNEADEDMKYTFESKISVTPTTLGSKNAFLPGADGEEILSQFDEKLILPGPEAPVLDTFNVANKNNIDPNEINPAEPFDIEFSGDSKSMTESVGNSKAGLQETGLSTVKIKASKYEFIAGQIYVTESVDLTDEYNISENPASNPGMPKPSDWTYNEDNGHFSGSLTAKTDVLEPNQDYAISIEFFFGETTTPLRMELGLYDEDEADRILNIHASSLGDKTVEITNEKVTSPTEWGDASGSVNFTFDFQETTNDDKYGPDAFDDVIIDRFELTDNDTGAKISEKTAQEVFGEPFDPAKVYTGVNYDISLLLLEPNKDFNLKLTAFGTEEGQVYETKVMPLKAIPGPPAAAPEASNFVATDVQLDKDTRSLSSSFTFDLDATTKKEAADNIWQDGSASSVKSIKVLDQSNDEVLGEITGDSLSIDENGNGQVQATVPLENLKANNPYTLKLVIDYGTDAEAPVLWEDATTLTTGDRGIADIVVGEPTVEGFTNTKTFDTTATVDISFAPAKDTGYEFKDFIEPNISSIEIVDVTDGNKVLGTASQEQIDSIVYGETDKTNISIDLAIPKNNTTYTLGVIATTDDSSKFTSSNITGVTDPSGAFEPEVKPMSITAADGDSENGYINTEFTFDIKTQTLPGVDSVETSESLLTSVSITIYEVDGTTEAETHDLTEQVTTGTSTVAGDFTTTTFTFKSDVGAKYMEGDYKYVVNYQYGEIVDGTPQSGSHESKVSFKDNGIDGVEKEDITITNASSYQTGFNISGEIKNDPKMFWKSYSVTRVTIIDDNGVEINEELIQSKLMNEAGDIITGETGPLAPDAEGNLSGKFEINVFGILPQADIANYSLQIINDDEEVPYYKQKLGKTEGVFTEDGHDFVNTDEANKDTEVIDDVSVEGSYDNLVTTSPTEENGLTTGSVKFTLIVSNTTALTIGDEITLTDSDNKEYKNGDGNTTITLSSAKESSKVFDVSIENLDPGKTYDKFKASFTVTDESAPAEHQEFNSSVEVDGLTFSISDLPVIPDPDPEPEDSSSNVGMIIGIVIGLLLLIGLLILLILFLLKQLKVSKTVEQSQGKVTFLINRDANSDIATQIKGRPLRGTQGERETQLNYSVVYHDSGKLAITLTGITNGDPIKGLVFVGDESANRNAEAKYESEMKAFEAELARWEEAKNKAKESGTDFNAEKPPKPAKAEIEKDIKVSGSVKTSLEEEKPAKAPKGKSQAEFTIE